MEENQGHREKCNRKSTGLQLGNVKTPPNSSHLHFFVPPSQCVMHQNEGTIGVIRVQLQDAAGLRMLLILGDVTCIDLMGYCLKSRINITLSVFYTQITDSYLFATDSALE